MTRPWGSLNPQTLRQPFADRPDYGDPPEDDDETESGERKRVRVPGLSAWPHTEGERSGRAALHFSDEAAA